MTNVQITLLAALFIRKKAYPSQHLFTNPTPTTAETNQLLSIGWFLPFESSPIYRGDLQTI